VNTIDIFRNCHPPQKEREQVVECESIAWSDKKVASERMGAGQGEQRLTVHVVAGTPKAIVSFAPDCIFVGVCPCNSGRPGG